jgi:hypothetical protein
MFMILFIPIRAISSQDLETRLLESLSALSRQPSRVTGYPGNIAAANLLTRKLDSMGVQEILTHRFKTPVPVDLGFHLQTPTDSIQIFGLWPNLVRTVTLPQGGLAGELVDVGSGTLDESKGIRLKDRIALIDFDSGRNWLDLFHLGVRAVIFKGDRPIHRAEANQKFLDVPANLPRFYAVARDTSKISALAESHTLVKLDGRMPWVDAEGQNLIGIIEGSHPDLKREAVILSAYYDAISPVPALAPGAEQACGAAALLDLAGQLLNNPPERTVILLFSSGHFQNLAGIRHFVPLLQESRSKSGRPLSREDSTLVERLSKFQIRLFIGLDLSSGSRILGIQKPQSPYRVPLLAPPLTTSIMDLAAAYEDSALGSQRILANGLKLDLSRQSLGSLTHTIPVDASVAAITGCPSLAFTTVNDSRPNFDSPVDRVQNISTHRLAPQVAFLNHIVPLLVDHPDLESWAWGNNVFGSIHGEVVHFGPRSYLPDQPTPGALVRVRLRNPTLSGVRPDFWAVADDSGRFEIPGVESGVIYAQPVRLEAYGMDTDSGNVAHAPDWGINGERRLPGRALTVLMDDLEEEVRIITAPVAGVTLFETFDPRNLITLEQAEVLDAITGSEPHTYGGCLPLTPPEMEKFGYVNRVQSAIAPVTVLFVPPGSGIKTVMSTGTYGLGKRLLLLNSTTENPEGIGYDVLPGEVLAQTSFRVARDMTFLNQKRISGLTRHGVRNRRLEFFHAGARTKLDSAELADLELDHRTFLDASRKSWSYAAAAYRDIGRTQSDVIQGALFLLASLVPFAHFMERLIFGFPDLRRQVLGYFGFFAAAFLALRYLHPAFELSISPAIILLGFIILSLGTLVTALGISRLNRELQQLAEGHRARGRAGLHRGGAVLTSISVGLAHLRRRPVRTGLTCGTLVLLTFSVLSFTSIRSSLRTNMVEVDGRASYDGILLRHPGWKTMEQTAYRTLADRFGAERTAPRAWLSVSSLASSFRVERADASIVSTGILGISGLSAQESRITAPQKDLLAGRWLLPDETDACLLPTGIADSLHIHPEALDNVSVRIFGESFRVVGILSPTALDRQDLNGESVTPLDPEAQQPEEARTSTMAGGQPTYFAHLPAKSTVVLPYDAVMRWERAKLVSIAVAFEDPERELAELVETLDLNLFAGLNGRRYLVNTVGISSVAGASDLIVPIGIAALIVLNTMLGSVYERTREIGTLNAIGLAPGHVSGLFMAEACACAVVGGVLGYLMGQAVAQTVGHWGLLPGLELNFSSLSAVFTLGLIMAVVLLSAIYPSRQAARVCTPGIERRWSPPSPRGDLLEMVLPFTLVESDASGMAAFLAEFWEIHQEQSIGAGFYVESVKVVKSRDGLMLTGRVWLAPFDQGVVQDVRVEMKQKPGDRYFDMMAVLMRNSGDYETWRRVCRTFLDDLRKQFLLWRTLNEADRRFYAEDLDRWVKD